MSEIAIDVTNLSKQYKIGAVEAAPQHTARRDGLRRQVAV